MYKAKRIIQCLLCSISLLWIHLQEILDPWHQVAKYMRHVMIQRRTVSAVMQPLQRPALPGCQDAMPSRHQTHFSSDACRWQAGEPTIL